MSRAPRHTRPTVAAIALLALGVWAVAQPLTLEPEGEHARVPVDPDAICDALRDAYGAGPFAEHVTITVRRAGGGERTDSLTIRAGAVSPGDSARPVEIGLGPLTLWTEADAIFGVHERAPDAYFTAPIERGGTALGAIEAALPPIPAPQLSLFLGDGLGCPDRIPYVPQLRWTECVVNAEARPSVATLTGVGAGVRVEMEAELEPIRLRRYALDFEEQGLGITGEVRRAGFDASDVRPIGVDTTGRSRVATIADLAPSPGSVRSGDVLTGWLVHPATAQTPGVVAELVPLTGPSVVVLFNRWNRDVSLGLKSALEATAGFDGYRVVPLAVFEPDAGDPAAPTDLRAWLDEIRPRVEPLELVFSSSPDRTIRRLNRYADVAVLVLDEHRVVRHVERIDKIFVYDEPGVLTNRIVASLLAR
jgi:hypothetical protein